MLGTMLDRVVAERMGTRTFVAVSRMRRVLGLKRLPAQGWTGTAIPQAVPLAEVVDRYQRHLRGERWRGEEK
jgi:hypothetical protein